VTEPAVAWSTDNSAADDPPAAPADRRPPRRSTVRPRLLTALPAIVLVLAFFGAWALYVQLSDVRAIILPSPFSVFRSLIDDWAVYRPQLVVTLRQAVLGYLLAIVVGVTLALLVTASRTLRLALYPLLVASQAMPVIALAPLLVIWFGYGPTSKILVAALIAFFPIVVNTSAGLTSLDGSAVTLMRSFPATKRQVLLRARIPNALPQFFSGLKVAAPLAVVGAVVGEWVSADAGLGYLIIRANATLSTEIVFGSIALLSLAGIALFVLVSAVEWLALPWHRKAHS
jgi:ABC-type nitrate/sulfonate/bicarbonate transport system permease component